MSVGRVTFGPGKPGVAEVLEEHRRKSYLEALERISALESQNAKLAQTLRTLVDLWADEVFTCGLDDEYKVETAFKAARAVLAEAKGKP